MLRLHSAGKPIDITLVVGDTTLCISSTFIRGKIGTYLLRSFLGICSAKSDMMKTSELWFKPQNSKAGQGPGRLRLPGGRADRRRDGADRHARPDRGRRAARLDGALERAGARQDLPAAGAQGDRLPLAVLPRPDPGQDRWPSLLGDRRADRRPGLRPLEADDRGPGLAPARGAADHLRPGRRASSSRSPSNTASSVKKGDLLARLESQELEKELKRLIAEKADADARPATSHPAQQGNRRRARREASSSRAQLARGQDHRPRAPRSRSTIIAGAARLDDSIRAPQDGIVTTWEAKKNLLGRPVEIGQELIQIAGDRRRVGPGGRGPRRRHGPDPRGQEQARGGDQARARSRPGRQAPGLLRHGDRPRAPLPRATSSGSPPRPRLVEQQARRQGHGRLQRRGPQGLPQAQQPGRCGPGPRSAPGSTAATPGWPTSCSATSIQVFYETVLFRWPFLQVMRTIPDPRIPDPMRMRHPPSGHRCGSGMPASRPAAHQPLPGGSAMLFSKKAAALAASVVAALSVAALAQNPRSVAGGQPAPRRSSSASWPRRLDREVRRRGPPRGRDREHRAPDRHAGATRASAIGYLHNEIAELTVDEGEAGGRATSRRDRQGRGPARARHRRSSPATSGSTKRRPGYRLEGGGRQGRGRGQGRRRDAPRGRRRSRSSTRPTATWPSRPSRSTRSSPRSTGSIIERMKNPGESVRRQRGGRPARRTSTSSGSWATSRSSTPIRVKEGQVVEIQPGIDGPRDARRSSRSGSGARSRSSIREIQPVAETAGPDPRRVREPKTDHPE